MSISESKGFEAVEGEVNTRAKGMISNPRGGKEVDKCYFTNLGFFFAGIDTVLKPCHLIRLLWVVLVLCAQSLEGGKVTCISLRKINYLNWQSIKEK